MATHKPHRAICARTARIVPNLPGGDPLQADGECLRLQGLVAAYQRNLKHVKGASSGRQVVRPGE